MAEAKLTGDWGCFVCEQVIDPADFTGVDAACPKCGRQDGLRELTVEDLDIPDALANRERGDG